MKAISLPDKKSGQILDNLPGILVVGDWIVEEHWIVGEHRWPSSARTALRHTRALQDKDGSVRSLCGAGQVATILHQACDATGRRIANVLGLGLWHPEDTTALANMLDPIQNQGKTPHSICHKENAKLGKDILYNLAGSKLSEGIGTTRVFKIYVQIGDSVDLVHRVDWELHEQGQNSADKLGGLAALEASAVNGKPLISNIVVNDLCKGAVTAELIDGLSARFPDANWFISSKAWCPLWLEKSLLRRDRVKLVVIPELAIIDGIRGEYISSRPWLTATKEPSLEALRVLDEVSNKFKEALIVALPEGMSVLARATDLQSGQTYGIVQPNAGLIRNQEFVPITSILFPALVAHLIQSRISRPVIQMMESAFSFVKRWVEVEVTRLSNHSWLPMETQVLKLNDKEIGSFAGFSSFPWDDTRELWEKAFSGLGILQISSSLEFHLWRAMTDINGYVACLPNKRAVLQALVQEGRAFFYDRSRPRSLMIIDKPGSGKSFLVSRLAKSLGMRFLSFNITQLHNRSDLIECFDTIVTTQAQEPKQGVLVFIDEINARLGGQHVYDAFLAPLEDGIYVRAGKTFHIEPCLWVFAGTAKPVRRTQDLSKGRALVEPDDRTDKGSDFESRLTLPPLDLESVPETGSELATMEKIYVGVAAIRAAFPDVSLISKKVLAAFSILPHDVGPREITRWVKTFGFVQYGRICAKNLPTNWDVAFSPKKRNHDPTNEAIKLWEKFISEWKEMKEPDSSLISIRGELGL